MKATFFMILEMTQFFFMIFCFPEGLFILLEDLFIHKLCICAPFSKYYYSYVVAAKQFSSIFYSNMSYRPKEHAPMLTVETSSAKVPCILPFSITDESVFNIYTNCKPEA